MNNLKVAFIVGTLGQGGAEKQLVYMAKALQESGVQVRIYCLTKDEYFESALSEINLTPSWIGKNKNPIIRLFSLIVGLLAFRPHLIQSAHFYTNLYSALAAPFYNAISIGSLRSDTFNEVNGNDFWGLGLLKMPRLLIANSNTAKRNAVSLGTKKDRIYILPNAIDLDSFDRELATSSFENLPFRKISTQINAVVIGSLVPVKRFDRFLRALQKTRMSVPSLQGFVIGDGDEKRRLESLAVDLGLIPDGVCFVGRNDNIPAILGQSDFLVLSSDNEGMPNVILEAMVARLPVITTPAGDANVAVENGVTGFVVPFEDIDALASQMVNLSISENLRKQFGEAGRKRVEQNYSYALLGNRLLAIYTEMGSKLHNSHLQKALLSIKCESTSE